MQQERRVIIKTIQFGKGQIVTISIPCNSEQSHIVKIHATQKGLEIGSYILSWIELKKANRTIVQNQEKTDSWKPKIKMTDEGNYLVESQTGNGHFYEVNASLTMCQCPHYQKRLIDTNKKCKHMDQLEAYLKKEGIEIKKSEEESGGIPF